ncbi:putative AAA domain-containing protein [Colletotrichum chlorophyti]|uniref:Putative AAA domain-containing protein n=1 Tax=Colletotrichum chlorophyti TaxID=708187 RepID=A0A1Q8RTL1_9PEZI|nr:putative AAA domain-containing protein [Colletotrichum chlorophyti]
MSHSRGLAILQKTYDDTYLKCSTAVYYESQGDEKEAMRCWKNALDQISDQRITKVLPNYVPASETEEALIDSIAALEIQCQERIDLLEALRISREDALTPRSSNSPAPKPFTSPDPPNLATPERGWIGQGTIPAIRYPELSRPALPKRPSFPSRTSSEQAIVGRSQSQSPASSSPFAGPSGSPRMTPKKEHTMRSPSPEKYTMRTTLRPGKPAEKTLKSSRKLTKGDGPGASKAATLAWSALSSRERLARASPMAAEPSTSFVAPAPPSDQLRKPAVSSSAQWDVHTRRLVTVRDVASSFSDSIGSGRNSDELSRNRPSALSVSAASSALNAMSGLDASPVEHGTPKQEKPRRSRENPFSISRSRISPHRRTVSSGAEDPNTRRKSSSDLTIRRKPVADAAGRPNGNATSGSEQDKSTNTRPGPGQSRKNSDSSLSDTTQPTPRLSNRRRKGKRREDAVIADVEAAYSEDSVDDDEGSSVKSAWKARKKKILKSLPSGIDETAAKQILNEIIVQGDEVHWSDVAGLEIAKNALRETVVYPFLRPDLFMGLREPARGMLLFGPPGTGKTMLARAVATESRSTFFSISASSLTSKYLGESEKLVRALFSLAKALAPSIIFVDEIDSLLSQRSGSGEHEATRRIKTEFLIQWSDLQRAAAGRAVEDKDKNRGDPNRVLVLAATNLPWAIDEAARRRFVRRQYIPLPEPETRSTQLRTLLGQQKHSLTDSDIERLVLLTDGFSGSDITALAKDAAMGPLRSLGEALLHMTMEEIRPISLADFEASLTTIRPSVSKAGLKEYEDWAKEFGERGG